MADLTGDESQRAPSVTAQRETTVLSFPTSSLPAAAGEEDFTSFFSRMYAPLCSYAEGFVNADAADTRSGNVYRSCAAGCDLS